MGRRGLQPISGTAEPGGNGKANKEAADALQDAEGLRALCMPLCRAQGSSLSRLDGVRQPLPKQRNERGGGIRKGTTPRILHLMALEL